jgi:hypothetical protein
MSAKSLPQFDFQTPNLVADLVGGARGAHTCGRSFRQSPEFLVKGLLDRYEPGDFGVQCFGFHVIAQGIGSLTAFCAIIAPGARSPPSTVDG